MITLFMLILLVVFGRLFVFGLRAAWGLTKLIVTVILLPLTLIAMLLHGFVFIAIIGLVVVALASFVSEVV